MPIPKTAAFALCLGLLAGGPAALAQGGGSGGGGSSGGSGGSTGGSASGSTGGGAATSPGGTPGVSQPGTPMLGGSSGQGGAGRTGASPGPSGPGRRAQTEGQLRDAGVAPPPEQEQRQLRDLNALSRELTPPGTPVPAPEAEPPRR